MTAAATYLEHLTTDGERWDQIAHAYYGDPHAYGGIVAANPAVAITPRLAGGLRLRVPVIDAPAPVLEELPPWKR